MAFIKNPVSLKKAETKIVTLEKEIIKLEKVVAKIGGLSKEAIKQKQIIKNLTEENNLIQANHDALKIKLHNEVNSSQDCNLRYDALNIKAIEYQKCLRDQVQFRSDLQSLQSVLSNKIKIINVLNSQNKTLFKLVDKLLDKPV